MRVYSVTYVNKTAEEKYISECTTLSLFQRVHIIYYILLQYPYVKYFPYTAQQTGMWENM